MRNSLLREAILTVLIVISIAAWRFDHYYLERRLKWINVRASFLERELDEVNRTGMLHGMPPAPGFPRAPKPGSTPGQESEKSPIEPNPASEICLSNRVELEILPRTGD